MAQVSAFLRRNGDYITYWCQGCEDSHQVTVAPGRWTFDGKVEAPTFSPSVLSTSGHFMKDHKPGDHCWCTWNAEHPDDDQGPACHRCHTFIRAGMVEFLSDCSHGLAGQTLPLPPLPEHMQGDRWHDGD